MITRWLGHDDDDHHVDGNGVGGGLADGDDDDEIGTRSVGSVCVRACIVFSSSWRCPPCPPTSQPRASYCSHVNVEGVDILRTVQCACSTVL